MKIRKKTAIDPAVLDVALHFNVRAIVEAAELLQRSDPQDLRGFLGMCLMLSIAAAEFVEERSEKKFKRLCAVEQAVRNAIIYGPPAVRDLLITKPS